MTKSFGKIWFTSAQPTKIVHLSAVSRYVLISRAFKKLVEGKIENIKQFWREDIEQFYPELATSL